MHGSSEPELPTVATVDHTVSIFRAYVLTTACIAVVFGVSWRENHGLRSLMEGVFLSLMLFAVGCALLLTVRARELTEPTSIRAWMRPTATAIVIFGLAVAGLAFWRWLA